MATRKTNLSPTKKRPTATKRKATAKATKPKPTQKKPQQKLARTPLEEACFQLRAGNVDGPSALLAAAAQDDDPLALAACAQVALFRGAIEEAAGFATRSLARPIPRAPRSVFVSMCRIVRSAAYSLARPDLVDTAVERACKARGFVDLVETCLRTDAAERLLIEKAAPRTTDRSVDRARFSRAVRDARKRKQFRDDDDARFQHETALAWSMQLDDELLRRFAERPATFSWTSLLEVAFALLRGGDPARAMAVLDDGAARWPIVHAAMIVPIELATHPTLRPHWTAERGVRWLHTPRADAAASTPRRRSLKT